MQDLAARLRRAASVPLARNSQQYECRRWRAEALVELQRFEDALGEIERMLAENEQDAWAQNEHSYVPGVPRALRAGA